MRQDAKVVVVGLGEIGKALYELISKYHEAVSIDAAPPTTEVSGVSVMHICYPFQIADFIGETARYIERLKPSLTIINSTVAVGTTRSIAERTGSAVVHSPVRGKHQRMGEDLTYYTKFVGGTSREHSERAAEHFTSIGLKSRVLSSPEATELAKLTETTYFGLLIAWAQEVERYADQLGENYDEIASFYEEISFFPRVKYFPGVIGGHCVMPNIEILSRLDHSDCLKAIESSNRKKIDRESMYRGRNKHSVQKEKGIVPIHQARRASPA